MSIRQRLKRFLKSSGGQALSTASGSISQWAQLQCAYGTAEKVPGLLAQMVSDAKAEIWSDLYAFICHQGTVYSASFAALPALEAAARSWLPEQRLMPLVLAADICNSTDVAGDRQQLLQPYRELLPSLRQLLHESLDTPGWPEGDYVYLMRARLALDMDEIWGEVLDGLVDGEFVARCTACGAESSCRALPTAARQIAA